MAGVQGQNMAAPGTLMRSTSFEQSNGCASLTTPRSSSYGADLSGFSAGGGTPMAIDSSNHGYGSVPLSFHRFPAAGSLGRHVSATGLEGKLHHQLQTSFSSPQFLQDSQMMQQQQQQLQFGSPRLQVVGGGGIQQQMQGLGPAKLEAMHQLKQQNASISSQQPAQNPASCVKREQLNASLLHQSLFASHLQHQSQQLQAHLNLLKQQSLLSQQGGAHLQQQQQQSLRHQLPGIPKQTLELGLCPRRLMQYVFNQRQRPQDNNIGFWRRFVAEFFALGAKKRWCVSQYGSNGRQTTGVFPQDVWSCEICGSRPGRGFETTVEVLPRLYKIKYDSGILDELLFVDSPNEYRLSSGHMVLEYGKAVQESIFEHLRVVREGQLRVIFTADLKIVLWEFCARGHEELLPRKLLSSQVAQLASVAQKYHNSVNQSQGRISNPSVEDLRSNCQLFMAATRQLTRTLEAPTVNDLGYTKRYVRCLQISEVVNSMKDLIDFSQENRIGPRESLRRFPCRSARAGSLSNDVLQQNQMGTKVFGSEQTSGQAGSIIMSPNDSSLSCSVSLTHNPNSVGAVPASTHHSESTVLLQNNGYPNTSHPEDISTSSGLASNSGNSSSLTRLGSFQSCHQSVTSGGESSSNNRLSCSAQANSSNAASNMAQQSSRQANSHESSVAFHQIQEFTMPPYMFNNEVSHQQAATAGANIVGFTGGMMSENSGVNANGYRSSNNPNEMLTANEGGGIGSSVSDSDSANVGGGVTSSFSDGLVNQSYLSGLGSSLSVNNTESLLIGGGSLHNSVIGDEQSLLQDPSSNFPYDFGSNDIFSWNN